ncbi:phage tail protein [Motilibacter deserti]|uniref:Phage tail protein n=1 Tax=Motilibacter deserti TaxID=2714956 RepID=A0ABX0GUI6_9ACTN|nr:phage tail protein [Motilibacter deserti]NHC13806.1 phage tail protein [Motilibacter deserti]
MADEKTEYPAVAYMFSVEIDGHKLGLWNSFEGLGWETTVETREEGGNNFFVHQLPGRLKYPNVKVGRPIGRDSSLVAEWFASLATGVTRTTARIAALGPDGQEVVSWSLDGVIPVRWTGPGFGVENLKAASETLELAHHGFIEAAHPGRRAG